jgi:hypothetical protein
MVSATDSPTKPSLRARAGVGGRRQKQGARGRVARRGRVGQVTACGGLGKRRQHHKPCLEGHGCCTPEHPSVVCTFSRHTTPDARPHLRLEACRSSCCSLSRASACTAPASQRWSRPCRGPHQEGSGEASAVANRPMPAGRTGC